MKRVVFMFLLVSCICSLAIPGISGQISLDNQPLSAFETLYNNYKPVVAKSQYETQAQYETRVKIFFQNDPVRYFDLYVSTYYVADTQIFYAYFLDAYTGSCPDIKLPPNYQGLPLKESYDRDSHYLTIDNPNEMGLEKGKSPDPKYSSLSVVFVYNKNLIPSEAQAMATNIGLRIGIKFNYRADGMLCDRYTAGHLSSSYPYNWIDGYSSYSLLGSFQLITLYNTQDKSIYLQKNINDSSSPPVANAGADQIVFDKITLDASQSSDPNNDIVSYQWQLQYRGNSGQSHEKLVEFFLNQR